MANYSKDVNLIAYLPQFIQEYREMQQIMSAENPEFKLTWEETQKIKDNQYIISCDEVGIARFERILKITPTSEDTLQSRISRVLIRWNDVVPYTWKVFLQKLQTLCGDDFDLNEDWNNYLLELTTHLDVYGQVDELENILGYMPPANIEIIANNVLEYLMSGTAFVATGLAFTNLFNLTDSYQVNWTFNADAGAAASGSGTCEIMLTDSFQGEIFGSEAEAGAFVAHQMTEQIEVSDTFKGTIQLDSASNTGFGITYTEII